MDKQTKGTGSVLEVGNIFGIQSKIKGYQRHTIH